MMKSLDQIERIASTLKRNGYSVALSPNTCAILKDERPFLITTDAQDELYVRFAFLCVDVLEKDDRGADRQLRAAMATTARVKGVKAIVQGDFLHFVVESLFTKVDEIQILERAFECCLYAEEVYRGIMEYDASEPTPTSADVRSNADLFPAL